MKKQILIAGLGCVLGLSLSFGTMTVSAAENTFVDEGTTSSWEWAGESIQWAYEEGIIAGKTGGEGNVFDADSGITRAEAAVMLVKWHGINSEEYGDSCEIFTDVEDGEWYTKFVNAAYENGLIAGKGDGCFDPAGSLTRAESTALLVTAAEWEKETADAGFTDVPKAWHTDYINTAYAHGIVAGKETGVFAPLDDVTRAEFVVMLNATQNEIERNLEIIIVPLTQGDFVLTNASGQKLNYDAENLKFTGDLKVVYVQSTTVELMVYVKKSESFTFEMETAACEFVYMGKNMYVEAAGTNIQSIIMKKDGTVQLVGENMDYNVKMTASGSEQKEFSDTGADTVILGGKE